MDQHLNYTNFQQLTQSNIKQEVVKTVNTEFNKINNLEREIRTIADNTENKYQDSVPLK